MTTYKIEGSRSGFRDRVSTDSGNWPGRAAQLALAAAAALPPGEPTDLVSVTVSLSAGPSVSVNAVASASPAAAVQDEPPADPGNPAALRSAARDNDDSAAAAAYGKAV